MFTYEFPTRSGRTYLFFLEANDDTPRPFLFNADGQQIGSDEGKYYVLYADTNATVTFVGVGSSPAADFRILEYYLGHETYSEHHVVSLGGRKVEVCGDVDGEVVTVQPPQDGSASVHQLIVERPHASYPYATFAQSAPGHSAIELTRERDDHFSVFVGAPANDAVKVGFNDTRLGACGREDADCDGLGDAFEKAIGTCSSADDTHVVGWDCALFHPSDTDDDGIPDRAELLGHCLNDECVPYAAFGADPLHKDVFVEVDYNDQLPSVPVSWAENVVRSFADGRADDWRNPDGAAGLHFHFDMMGVEVADYDCEADATCTSTNTSVNHSLVYSGGGSNRVSRDCNDVGDAKQAAIEDGHFRPVRRPHSFYVCLNDAPAQGVSSVQFMVAKSSTGFVREFGRVLGLTDDAGGGGANRINHHSTMAPVNARATDHLGVARFSRGEHDSLFPYVDERRAAALHLPMAANGFDDYWLRWEDNGDGTLSVDFNRDGVFNDVPVRAPLRISRMESSFSESAKSHGTHRHRVPSTTSSAPALVTFPGADGDDVYMLYVDNNQQVMARHLQASHIRDAYSSAHLAAQWSAPAPLNISTTLAVSTAVVDGSPMLVLRNTDQLTFSVYELTRYADNSLAATYLTQTFAGSFASDVEPVSLTAANDLLYAAWRRADGQVWMARAVFREILSDGGVEDGGQTSPDGYWSWSSSNTGLTSERAPVLASRPTAMGDEVHLVTQAASNHLVLHKMATPENWSTVYSTGQRADIGTKPSLVWMPTDHDAPNGAFLLSQYTYGRPRITYINDDCGAGAPFSCSTFHMLNGDDDTEDGDLGLSAVIGQSQGSSRLFVIGYNGNQIEFFPQGDGFSNAVLPDNNDFVMMHRHLCTTLRDSSGDDRSCGDKRALVVVAEGQNEANNTVPLVGDFDGDGFDDAFFYKAGSAIESAWYGTATGTFDVVTQPNANANYVPAVGDFDGDGVDDIFFYRPGSGNEYLHFGESNRTFTSLRTQSVNGTYTPLVGDYNNDGRDDVLWYKQSSGITYIWYATATRNSWDTSQSPPAFNRTGYKPVAGDFNGDGAGDIFWFKAGCDPERFWFFNLASGAFVPSDAPQIDGDSCSTARDYNIKVADLNADGTDDLIFARDGVTTTKVWLMQRNTAGRHPETIRLDGDGIPALGDFNGDDVADTLWVAP